jgi:hypothetical protein
MLNTICRFRNVPGVLWLLGPTWYCADRVRS